MASNAVLCHIAVEASPPMLVRLALIALFLLPGGAFAAGPTIASHELPVAGERTLASARTVARFNLVAIHWRGSGTVELRVRGTDGRWSEWLPAAPEAEDLPDRGSAEAAARRGWRIGSPWWVGPSDRIETRTRGSVRRVRAWTVWSPEVRVPLRATAAAGAPPVVPRSAWGADESIRRAKPTYAPVLRTAIIHHTAGRNGYTRAEAAAIIRGIYTYHVKGNGWNDIGYNFLVDRFGTIYEGRYGGIDRNVVGAHAEGFNTGSVGIAVLGTYDAAAPPKAAEDAVAAIIAWRLDQAHVDPLSMQNVISNGNSRFGAGLPVFLRTVSGHRDTGFTDCPGDRFYARLGELAKRAQAIGLPKLWEPRATGRLGGFVRVQGRLSGAIPWTVTITDALGSPVATGTGVGPTVDWTWDATFAAPGAYRWSIAANGATSASGAIGASTGDVAVALTGLAADPETVTPNQDGQADTTTLVYRLNTAATVTVTVLDAVGAPVAVVQPPTRKVAGEHTVTFDPLELPDGAYQVEVRARGANGSEAVQTVQVLVTRTLGGLAVAPAAFSPNADRRADRISFRFQLASAADVKVRILRDGRWVATPFAGRLEAGAQRIEWDGTKRIGRLRDGDYEVVVEATDTIGTGVVRLPFVADTRPPAVKIVSTRPLRLWVSEPAKLTLRIDGQPVKRAAQAPGELRVPGYRTAARVRAVAWDAAGNRSIPVRLP
jgi:hypothetical protein